MRTKERKLIGFKVVNEIFYPIEAFDQWGGEEYIYENADQCEEWFAEALPTTLAVYDDGSEVLIR